MKKGLLIGGIVVAGLGVLFLAFKVFKKNDIDKSDPELEALIKKIENAKK
jgi:hypothetical protein